LYLRTNSIPDIIVECIYNARKNLETEGLFRVNGDKQKMGEVLKLLELGKKKIEFFLFHFLFIYFFFKKKIGTFEKLNEDLDQHTSASVLKHYFRELPDPLFTYQYHNAFLDTIKLDNEQFVIQNLKLINSLPFSHRIIFITIFPFLQDVTKQSSLNLMNEGNIGIVFGPTLMRLDYSFFYFYFIFFYFFLFFRSLEEKNGQVDMTNRKATFIEKFMLNSEQILPFISVVKF
jgi:hypothetical protein